MKAGRLEVITGPMYSGKSEELMRRLRRDRIAGRRVVLFKPTIDNRFEEDYVVSHNGAVMEAIRADTGREVLWDTSFEVFGIDEIQFFDEHILGAIKVLVEDEKRVIVSGLDMTFRREPFGVMPELLSIAESVTKLSAVCHRCGDEAYFTQRLTDGHPSNFDEPTVEVGGLDSYEARCRNCFESGT